MKTIMDAVNYLKGDLKNVPSWSEGNYVCECVKSIQATKVGSFTVTRGRHDRSFWAEIGTREEFNDLVNELSNWQPTLPKVETVEVGGMIYGIGNIYEFSDGYDHDWTASRLIAANDKLAYKFESQLGSWSHIRECASSLGTITPAPTKLIDGEAYMFDCQGETRMGFKFGEYLRIDKYTKFSIELCTNITHLTAAK